MKKILFFLSAILMSASAISQGNVGIGTSSPHASSILDISSTTDGVLIPRMTYAQRNAIASPAQGLIVYQTNSQLFTQPGLYFYDGNQWKRFARSDELNSGGGTSSWSVSGDNQYHNLSGNVGIGTELPHPSAKLDVSGTVGGILFPRVTTAQQFAINNPADGLIIYNTDNNQIYHNDDGTWRGILNTTFWLRPLTNRSRITNASDSVGIGLNAPLARLQVANGTHANYSSQNGHIMVGLANSTNLAIGNYEILARDNGSEAPLYLQQEGGTVRIGSGPVAANTKLQISDGDIANLTSHGQVVIGEISSQNIVMDENEMQARNNGTSSPLNLQAYGNMVRIGSGTMATGAKLHITDGDFANLTDHGHMVIGETNNVNLVMDENEIQARTGGIKSTLFLQRNGGLLDIGGTVRIESSGSSGEILRLDGVDPNIGFYQNGIYKSFISQSGDNLWIQSNGRMRIEAPQIAIGQLTDDADNYKLAVAGHAICTELRVESVVNWPDYVFSKEYKLTPLEELSNFIYAHNHLPNIPKASEVESEGFDVGEMNKKLLEKIEELTLYVIDLQNQVNQLKAECSN